MLPIPYKISNRPIMPMTQNEKISLLGVFCANTSTSLALPDAKNSILAIMNATNWEALTANTAFNGWYGHLEELLINIEQLQTAGFSGALQARKALQLLSDKKDKGDPEEFDACKTLIQCKLMTAWEENIRKLYQKGVEMLENWIHFFISYTNQSAPGVNRAYKKMISNEIPYQEIKQFEQERNLIGRLISRYVKMQRVSAFYDKDALAWGNEWRERILNFASTTYGFIQIVETEMFVQDPPKNVCLTEYETYKKSIEGLCADRALGNVQPVFYFLISNPDKLPNFRFEPAGLHECMKRWVEHIYKVQYATLYKNLSNGQLRQKIQEAAFECKNYQKQLFSKYVESIN